jgi:hypothetical protein
MLCFEICFGSLKDRKLAKKYPENPFLSKGIHSSSISPFKNEMCKNVKGGLTLLFHNLFNGLN